MKPKLYFGHPVNTYGTELEKKLLATIQHKFFFCNIVNPSDKHHCEEYERWTREKGNGMNYFLNEVLPSCDSGVFLAFRDGKWGAGVWKEMQVLVSLGKAVFEVTCEERFLAADFQDESRVLSIEETRARIRDKDRHPLPY